MIGYHFLSLGIAGSPVPIENALSLETETMTFLALGESKLKLLLTKNYLILNPVFLSSPQLRVGISSTGPHLQMLVDT